MGGSNSRTLTQRMGFVSSNNEISRLIRKNQAQLKVDNVMRSLRQSLGSYRT